MTEQEKNNEEEIDLYFKRHEIERPKDEEEDKDELEESTK